MLNFKLFFKNKYFMYIHTYIELVCLHVNVQNNLGVKKKNSEQKKTNKKNLWTQKFCLILTLSSWIVEERKKMFAEINKKKKKIERIKLKKTLGKEWKSKT